jgi:hypothetical protein
MQKTPGAAGLEPAARGLVASDDGRSLHHVSAGDEPWKNAPVGIDRSLVENQRRFRLANEEIDRARIELGFDGDAVPFLCECPDRSCTNVVPLRPDEYARARAETDRYVVLPGHVPPGENVVERHNGYVITTKGTEA